MKPRILFVDHAGVLGGAELYLLDIARRLQDRAHVVVFEPGPFVDRLREAGVSCEVIAASDAMLGVEREGGRMQDLKAIPAVLGMVNRVRRLARGYDVVFANSQKGMIVGALAGWLARRPVVWNLHDIMTADHFSGMHRALAVQMANRFIRRVLVNSEATRVAFTESGGRTPTSTVFNGHDPSVFDRVTEEAVAAQREALGAGRYRLVGVFSRLAPWKGQHVLLRALPALPDVRAVLVGGALFQDDKAYEAQLRREAESLGVADRVLFLGFRDDVPLLMRSVDIVAHTSISPEPFGRVIVEGMLARRPVIAAEAGGALEIIDEAGLGMLTPPGDEGALADAIRQVLADPDAAERMASAGRRAAEARFTIDRTVQDINEQLAQVLGDSYGVTARETTAPSVKI
ncbi:MAG: glycosyltransferase family 4 protein [Rhodothermales bacterium]